MQGHGWHKSTRKALLGHTTDRKQIAAVIPVIESLGH